MKMNKKFFALALAAFLATGSATISAANNNDKKATCTEQSKNCNGENCKKENKGHKDHKGRKGHKGHKGGKMLFEGVELSAEQQKAIKAFREQQKSAEQANRQKNQESFMNELKSILTPEQFQQVEQNAAKIKEARAQMDDNKGRDKSQRKDKRSEGRNQQKDSNRPEKARS